MKADNTFLSRGLAIASAISLAGSYLWGIAYYDSYLLAMGLRRSQFPIDIYEVYINAYFALVGVFSLPWSQVSHIAPTKFLASVAILIFASALLATPQGSDLFSRRRRTRVAKSDIETTIGKSTTFVSRLALNVSAFLVLPFGVLILSALGTIILTLTAAIPGALGRHRAEREIIESTYKAWPEATWIGADGEPQSGHLLMCSPQWCAMIQDGQSVVIPSTQVGIVRKTLTSTDRQ